MITYIYMIHKYYNYIPYTTTYTLSHYDETIVYEVYKRIQKYLYVDNIVVSALHT